MKITIGTVSQAVDQMSATQNVPRKEIDVFRDVMAGMLLVFAW